MDINVFAKIVFMNITKYIKKQKEVRLLIEMVMPIIKKQKKVKFVAEGLRLSIVFGIQTEQKPVML